MSGLATELFDTMLDAGASVVDTLSLHAGNPGASGSDNEIEGGDYERVPEVSWHAASGGQVALEDDPEVAVPAGNTLTHVGMWTSGGQWRGAAVVDPPEKFGAQGTARLASLVMRMENPSG